MPSETISAQQTLDLVRAGNQSVYAITLNPDNTIKVIRLQPFNLVNQIARGIDFESTYRVPMSDLIASWGGDLTLRALGTHYIKNYSATASTSRPTQRGPEQGSGPPDGAGTRRSTTERAGHPRPLRRAPSASGTYLNSNIVAHRRAGRVDLGQSHRRQQPHCRRGLLRCSSPLPTCTRARRAGAERGLLLQCNLTNKDPAIVAPGPGGLAYRSAARERNAVLTRWVRHVLVGFPHEDVNAGWQAGGAALRATPPRVDQVRFGRSGRCGGWASIVSAFAISAAFAFHLFQRYTDLRGGVGIRRRARTTSSRDTKTWSTIFHKLAASSDRIRSS